MSNPVEPLRGEAAWKAMKKDVAERNEQAYARGRRERAARRLEEERQNNRDLPRRRVR